ncbi:methyl-accepting chemotaxis protein, partial [Frigidibacter oleivorans]|uniref:methyl-accepting chemotaxis protein n=1 Tax=Frigidibacter oleivorans TaxID=2487129 RepID=UPI0013E0B0FB
MTPAPFRLLPRALRSLYARTALLLALSVTAVAAILAVEAGISARSQSRDELVHETRVLTELLATDASGLLAFDRPDLVGNLISRATEGATRPAAMVVFGLDASAVARLGPEDPELERLALQSQAEGRTVTGTGGTIAVPSRFGKDGLTVGAVATRPDFATIRGAVQRHAAVQSAIGLGLLVIVLAIVIPVLRNTLSRPVMALNAAMARIAAGDHAAAVPGTGRGDEVGEMARTLLGFRDRLAAGEEAARQALLQGAALNASSAATIITDSGHHILHVNAAMTSLLATHAAALRVLNPQFDPAAPQGFRADRLFAQGAGIAAALTHKDARQEAELRLGDTLIALSVAPIHDAAGQRVGHVAEWRDVTAARRDAAVLAALDAMQARADFSPEGRLIAANDGFLRLAGIAPATGAGQDMSRMLHLETGADLVPLFAAAGRDGISGRIRLGQGDRVALIDGPLAPIRGAEGEVTRFVLLGTDVTEITAERARAEAERGKLLAAQADVVDRLRQGLARLAEGDLAQGIAAPFPDGYETLCENFNGAVGGLRDALRRLSDTAGAIRLESSEISGAADELSRRTERQAATLEQTAAALDQLTTSVASAAEVAGRANSMVTEARASAERSGSVVREAVSTMGEIAESSERISRITGVIDEIAFQTNLLALNAGVEAARAGEAGRGFAVVASEVRALAQRSSDAAREIAGLIAASSRQVTRGVDLVGQAGAALTGIESAVADIHGCVADIATSAREQSSGLAEINLAVGQLDQVTQQNAAMFEETTAASHALTREAEALAETMQRFRTGDDPAAPAPRPAAPAPRGRAAAGQPVAGRAGERGAR